MDIETGIDSEKIDEYIYLITKITAGWTIDVANLSLIERDTWYNWISGSFSKDDPSSIVRWVRNVVDLYILKMNVTISESVLDVRIQTACLVIKGLRNLTCTYVKIPETTKELDTIIANLECAIARLTKSYCQGCKCVHVPHSATVDILSKKRSQGGASPFIQNSI